MKRDIMTVKYCLLKLYGLFGSRYSLNLWNKLWLSVHDGIFGSPLSINVKAFNKLGNHVAHCVFWMIRLFSMFTRVGNEAKFFVYFAYGLWLSFIVITCSKAVCSSDFYKDLRDDCLSLNQISWYNWGNCLHNLRENHFHCSNGRTQT